MKISINTDINAPCCPCEIVNEDGRSLLVQTDWDFPGYASTFGWSVKDVQRANPREDFDFTAQCGILVCKECGNPFYPMEVEEDECPDCLGQCEKIKGVSFPCDHSGTDGTIDCPVCGVVVMDFINSAREFLENNDGATVEDPGYFEGDTP